MIDDKYNNYLLLINVFINKYLKKVLYLTSYNSAKFFFGFFYFIASVF